MSETSPLVEAQEQFIAAVPFRSTGSEIVSLADACGRTLYRDIKSPTALPPYNRAIVEGFLVRTEDTADASEESKTGFTIIGKVNPGDAECGNPEPGQAIQVVTGSLVPDGPYSIVRMWEADIDNDHFSISRPFPPRFFIEDKGCDLELDATAITAGAIITPQSIGTIASMGLNEVELSKKPVVTVFASGDELVPYTDPVTPGTMRDSNSIMLASAINANGATAKIAGIMSDDFEQFSSELGESLSRSDMVVISGGTAVGGRDFISDLVKGAGQVIVDGVPMRSGRPLIMGVSDNKPIVCVAGHPPEALRGFNLFGVAAINKLLGNHKPLPADD
ncbi:MAG: molybdopterin molybdotransferase MoeA [Gammaproteobacteria bacterium]